jgi:hypothetical protein
MNYWLEAVKRWNTGKKYKIPRRGTPEYQQVKAIEQQLRSCVSGCLQGSGAYSVQRRQLVRRLLQIEGNLPNTFVGDDNNDIDNIEEINFDIRTRLMEHKSGGPDQKLAQYFRELPRYITPQNFSNSQQLLAQYGNLFQDIYTSQQQQYSEARGISKKNLFN